MRNKKIMKNTTNSRVYKMALNTNMGCPICGLGKGCNRNRDNGRKSWKDNRDNQWRE